MHAITAHTTALLAPLHEPRTRNGHVASATPIPALGGGGVFWFEDDARPEITRVVRVDAGRVIELPSLPARALVLAHHGDTDVAVARDGRVFERSDHAWSVVTESPEGFAGREAAACGYQPGGALLLAAGIDANFDPADDLRILCGHTWSSWNPKGRPPRLDRGAAGWFAPRSAFVVMGTQRKPSPWCWEIDAARITRFERTGPGPYATVGTIGDRLLAWEVDGAATIDAFRGLVWSYDGAGVWTRVAEVAGEGNLVMPAACQFDPERAAIVGVGMALRQLEHGVDRRTADHEAACSAMPNAETSSGRGGAGAAMCRGPSSDTCAQPVSKDTACATKVSQEQADWLSKNAATASKLDAKDAEKIGAATTKMTECVTKLATGG